MLALFLVFVSGSITFPVKDVNETPKLNYDGYSEPLELFAVADDNNEKPDVFPTLSKSKVELLDFLTSSYNMNYENALNMIKSMPKTEEDENSSIGSTELSNEDETINESIPEGIHPLAEVIGLSQCVSIYQLCRGNKDEAIKTHQKFIKSQLESPGLLRAGMEYHRGDVEACKRTMIHVVNDKASGLPVIGHIKGVYHHMAGEKDIGDQCILRSTKSAVTGVVGMFLAPLSLPVMLAANVGTSVAYDTAASVVHSAVDQEPRYFGAGKIGGAVLSHVETGEAVCESSSIGVGIAKDTAKHLIKTVF